MRSLRTTGHGLGYRVAMVGMLAIALTLAACAGESEDPETEPAATEPEEPTSDPEEGEDEETTAPGDDPSLDPRIEPAVADLAEREGVEPGEVEGGTLEVVTWSDGSIGCPEDGMSYTQALVDGYRLILTLDGEEFHYHAAGEDELFYCADPIEPAEAPATS